MFCPRCGVSNESSDRYCRSCGYALPQTGGGPSTGTESRPAPTYGAGPGLGGDPGPASRGYAGFWKRFAAYFIDGIILDVVMTAIGFALGVNTFTMRTADVAPGRLATYSVISVVLSWLYFALLESSSSQATVGKMALSIVVTDRDGARISFARATGRYFGKILSAFILCIGYIMAGFTEKKQALHDLLAGTLVVNK